ncbi:hypothetical protein [Yokenella regensburgei]|uniref:hypothetical protein n=1 Tax=Yokenella regensburgei TaxID=158877 RepID=UPI0031D4D21C
MKENLSASLLDRLLQFVRWVDTWKKLLILLLLAAALTAGAVAWEYRSWLLEPVIRAVRGPVIDEDRLEAEMNAVMRDTDAMALAVWSVSIERNYREILYVRINEEKMPRLEGDGDIVLRLHVRETNEIIKLLDTSAACWPHAGATKIGMEAVRAVGNITEELQASLLWGLPINQRMRIL